MKPFQIIYYIFFAFIGAIALLLIVSIFPVAGNYRLMIVQSGSMEPAIKMGSIVTVRPADDYKIGDVITFGPYSRTQVPTTHRIYDIKVVNGEPRYITKGDANEEPDAREISKEDVLGKVLFSVPYLGFAVDFAKRPIGFVLVIVVPAVIIIYDEIKKIWNEIKKLKNNKRDRKQDKAIEENRKKDIEQDKEIMGLKEKIEELEEEAKNK